MDGVCLTAWTTIRPPVYSATERIKESGRFSRKRYLRHGRGRGKWLSRRHRHPMNADEMNCIIFIRSNGNFRYYSAINQLRFRISIYVRDDFGSHSSLIYFISLFRSLHPLIWIYDTYSRRLILTTSGWSLKHDKHRLRQNASASVSIVAPTVSHTV